MQIEVTDSGCLTLILSDAELSSMGLSFEQLDSRDPKTRRLLRTLLQVARRRAGFTPDGAVSVEALPLQGGCLLLLTPRPVNRDAPSAFFIADEDALLQIAAAWQQSTHPWGQSSSLYRAANGFWLLLYGIPPFSALLECAIPAAEGEPYIMEHGVPWFVGDALPQLYSRTRRLTASE